MDIRKIKKLIELLEESGINEIEIKEGEEGVRISRAPSGPPVTQQFAPMPQLPINTPMSPSDAAAAVAPAAAAPREPRSNEHVITAPMVGTYYSAPSPGAK